MRKILFVVFAAFLGACYQQRPLTLSITHIDRGEEYSVVYARNSYMVFRADSCKRLPDSIKYGTKITAQPTDKGNKCNCIFKRIK